MAKITNRETSTAFESAKRQIDAVWNEKHGKPCHDWIVNMAQGEKELRAFGYFLQPHMVDVIGYELHFKNTAAGQMAKSQWENLFFDILTKHNFSIYKKPTEQIKTWGDMTDTEKIGFSKGIWAKRRDAIGNYYPFEPEIQSLLCRIKNAPHPDALKDWIISTGVNIEDLVKP